MVKKYKKSIYIIITLIISCLLITYIFKSFTKNQDYIIKINEQSLSKEEFMIYFYEQKNIFESIGGHDIWEVDFDGNSAKDVAKNNTVKSIIYLKTAKKKATKLGLYLSEDEKKYGKESAINLKKEMENTNKNLNIPIKFYNIFITESMIQEKVYEYITDNFVVDENDFQKYFENYIKNNEQSLNNITIDYIFVKNNDKFNAKEKIYSIEKNLSYNSDFKDIEENPFINVYENVILEKGMFEPHIEDIINKLNQNNISKIIKSKDGFYIFKIKNIENPDIKELKELIKEEYIIDKKSEIYNMQMKIWIYGIKIEKNDEIWNTI